MLIAATFSSWLLALHLLSAFAFAGATVLFWALVVASRNVDTSGTTLAIGRVAEAGRIVVIAGSVGTIVFGIWLAIERAHVEVWSGWVIAAIVLWIVAVATGQRAGVEYMRAMTKAEELEAAGQTGSNAELLALNRTSRGMGLHAISTIAIFLILIDMIWKPGASDLAAISARADSWNFPLLVHVTGAMILVGGMLTAATALVLARGDERRLKLGFYSLLFVALPGLILTKLGATLIWHKESAHSLIGAAFPHPNDPHWIMVGGTALDGGGGLLVLGLILGWFGLRRLDGGQSDFLHKVPVVKKMTGETLLKLTTIISVALLAAYVLAIVAMSTKLAHRSRQAAPARVPRAEDPTGPRRGGSASRAESLAVRPLNDHGLHTREPAIGRQIQGSPLA